MVYAERACTRQQNQIRQVVEQNPALGQHALPECERPVAVVEKDGLWRPKDDGNSHQRGCRDCQSQHPMGQARSFPRPGLAEEEYLYDDHENGHQHAVFLADHGQRPEYGQSRRHQCKARAAVVGEALATAHVSEQGGQGEQSGKLRHPLGHVQHGADVQRREQPASGDPQRHPAAPVVYARHGPRQQPVREKEHQHATE